MRRIIKYKQSVHNSDVQISPQWHQWLRHTRVDPPSLNELSQDILRQEKLKILAADFDAKWVNESKLLDRPSRRQDQLSISSEDRDRYKHPLPSPGVATCNSRDNTSNSDKLDGVQLSSLSGSNKHEADSGASPSSKGPDSITETTFSEGPRKKFPDRGLPRDGWQPKSWDPIVVNCNYKSNN
ncbi:hypothetical protein EPUL_005331 [Erysiphe pulchra]|uniref:Uncharacterized protein n=1 Tax=Erysiphe pulchra TaxID=225359 RepID=A0A2S4PPJ9_9PEZI|nr:hypothetical protein EPUL_005331 [Erysiphe pulchra]